MEKTKKIKLLLLVLLLMLISGLVSGLSIYWWQKSLLDQKITEEKRLKARLDKANQTIRELKAKIAQLESEAKKDEKIPAPSDSEKIKPKITKKFGYIKRVYKSAGKNYLNIDYALLFTGEEAVEAAREDGVIGEGEELDTDYYIRNKNPRIRTFEIAKDIQIFAQTYNIETQGVRRTALDLVTFRQIFETNDPKNQNMIANPYWITLQDSVIVQIEEQFLP